YDKLPWGERGNAPQDRVLSARTAGRQRGLVRAGFPAGRPTRKKSRRTRRQTRGGRGGVSSTQAEAQSAARRIHANDARLDDVSLAHDLARVGDPLLGQLGDVDQPLDAALDLGEGAEGGELGDAPAHLLADLVLLGDARPGL